MSAVEEFVFGVTWQVIPKALGELLGGAEPDAAERILTAIRIGRDAPTRRTA
ncbi:hypothetical protein IU470_22720 [Nocardia abscessus]|uniref:Uncharacterized protein n=1 Tax=Nocardia abscessus TaxID=120957 RepID=A0ABS0CH34_9NOCA|nr:hypothetical protein [Nocardia abscessus]MBF6227909.1 hypothetical protein [Nocardia abscessus]